MNILFYHAYLTDDAGVWAGIVLEQFKCMEDSELLDNLNEIRINVISQEDVRIMHFVDLVHSFTVGKCPVDFRIIKNPFQHDDAMLNNLESIDAASENATMRWIYEIAQKTDANICYAHMKGITSHDRHLLKNQVNQYVKYYYWRQYLNWGVLERWRECVAALNDHDIAGVNFQTDPSPHYSGSFWWTTSDHIKSLPDPSTKNWWYKLKEETTNNWLKNASDRYRDEQWHCSRPDTKAFNIHIMSNNPASQIIRRKEYDAKSI